MTETKRDVFLQVLDDMADATELIPRNAINYWTKRYDAAGKVAVPQDVADWIEYSIEHHIDMGSAFSFVFSNMITRTSRPFDEWILTHAEIFAEAWNHGYTVEAE